MRIVMDFTCERCLVSFKQKAHLKAHLQRKVPCKAIACDKVCSELLMNLTSRKLADKTYDCEYCGKEFNHRAGKSQHKKICKENPANKEMISISKDEYLSLRSQVHNTTNNNINTVNNTQNITINVNNFGQEDLGHLMKRLEYYWHNKAHGLIEMTKDIHFDPLHPENHTFTITNQRAGISKVLENGDWVSKPCEDALDEVIYKVAREIEDFVEDKADYLKDKFPRSVESTNKWWDKVRLDEFDDKEYRNMIKRLIEMVVMHRHMIGKKII